MTLLTPPEPAENVRILVVDDDPTQCELLCRVLQNHGHIVTVASSGPQALALLDADRVDVLVSDLQMPGMSGVELLESVHRRDPDLPAIILTGQPCLETATRVMELGAIRYLAKPVTGSEIAAVIRQACRQRDRSLVRQSAMDLLEAQTRAQRRRMELNATFDRMLEGLWVAFQPIVAPLPGAIMAFEALLRSTEPGLPHPGVVLEAAEQLGRVRDLGRLVRRRAAEAFEAAPPEALLFVNLHAGDLCDPDLLDPCAPLSRIAHRVVLEITERATLSCVDDVDGCVSALRRAGFRIAIDDMGEGYAGLTSFARLEPEYVKLDMSLVRGIHGSPIRQRLVAALTGVCHSLGMTVIAEGVEVAEERAALLQLGCDWHQGYFYARPGRPFPALA